MARVKPTTLLTRVARPMPRPVLCFYAVSQCQLPSCVRLLPPLPYRTPGRSTCSTIVKVATGSQTPGFTDVQELSRHGISLLTVCKVERLKLHVAPGRGSVCCHSRFLQPLCKPLLSLCSVLSSLLLSLFTLGPRSRALAVSQSSRDKVHLAKDHHRQSSPNGKRHPTSFSTCAWAGRSLS